MSKPVSHKNIALILAVLSTVLQTVAIITIYFFVGYQRISYSVLLALITFALLYGTSFYLLRIYIKRKITPIYRAIQTNSTSAIKKLETEIYDDSNIIETVTLDVTDWLTNKTKEIDNLKKLEIYRKEYIGNVSHELNTPIFNIQGYIETLLDGGIDDPEINKKYLKNASKAINRMIEIVKDLETISGLESGNLILSYSTFDIVALSHEVIEAQEILAKTKNISITIKPGFEKPMYVNADRKWISQVLTNLIVNSISYGKVDGITKLAFYDMENSILVEVKDNGIGISSTDVNRIFERFYRVDKSRSRNHGGTGLGLSIVKHIIEAHNQTINVKSELNKGSSFTFTIEKSLQKTK